MEERRALPDFDPAPTELRPPPEHEGQPLHWVEHGMMTSGENIFVVMWQGGKWWTFGHAKPLLPSDAAKSRWRYLGPAEWRPQDVDIMAEQRDYESELSARVVIAAARVAELEAEVGRLKSRTPSYFSRTEKDEDGWSALSPNKAAEEAYHTAFAAHPQPDCNDRMRCWRDQLWQIMRQGWCSLESIQDRVLTIEMALGMGWVCDPETYYYHVPGMVLDVGTFSYVRPGQDAPNLIVIDDPGGPETAEGRAAARRWYEETCGARLSDGVLVHTASRVHERDLPGAIQPIPDGYRIVAESSSPNMPPVEVRWVTDVIEFLNTEPPPTATPFPARALAPPTVDPGLRTKR